MAWQLRAGLRIASVHVAPARPRSLASRCHVSHASIHGEAAVGAAVHRAGA